MAVVSWPPPTPPNTRSNATGITDAHPQDHNLTADALDTLIARTGFLVRCGRASVSTNQYGDCTVTFATPFPTACDAVVVSAQRGDTPNSFGAGVPVQMTAADVTVKTYRQDGTTKDIIMNANWSAIVDYIAIGH